MSRIQDRERDEEAGDSISVVRAWDLSRIWDSALRMSCVARDVYYRCYAWTVVRKHIAQKRAKHQDRRILEQVIIPSILARFEPRTILEIGRESYEAFYDEFFRGRELWTLDWDASKTPFGAINHIVGDAANLRRYFRDECFDFVLMNGVFGWGLNQPEAIERAFLAVHAVLVPGGIFVLGWNDTPDLVPVPLDEIQALKYFKPYFFRPLNGTSFKCSTCEHTYSFFVK